MSRGEYWFKSIMIPLILALLPNIITRVILFIPDELFAQLAMADIDFERITTVLLTGTGWVVISAFILLITVLRWTIYRFNDVGVSPWWILAMFIPIIGGVIIVVIALLPTNHYKSSSLD